MLTMLALIHFVHNNIQVFFKLLKFLKVKFALLLLNDQELVLNLFKTFLNGNEFLRQVCKVGIQT